MRFIKFFAVIVLGAVLSVLSGCINGPSPVGTPRVWGNVGTPGGANVWFNGTLGGCGYDQTYLVRQAHLQRAFEARKDASYSQSYQDGSSVTVQPAFQREGVWMRRYTLNRICDGRLNRMTGQVARTVHYGRPVWVVGY